MIFTLPDVVEEHFDELDMLWEQREGVLYASDWTAADLAELEERAEAHLDGLRLAGDVAIEVASPHLALGEASGACAATFVLMESGGADHARNVVESFERADDAALDGIRAALRHCSLSAIPEDMGRIAKGANARLRAAAFDVLAFQRVPTPEGLASLIDDEDPWVARLALEAAGRCPGVLQLEHVSTVLQGEIAALRRVALEAAARSGLTGLRELCLDAADSSEPVPEALSFLGVLGDPEDLTRLSAGFSRPELAAPAIQGLGALGRCSVVPAILEAMSDRSLAEEAAAAYARITGLEVQPLPTEDTGTEEEESDRPDVDRARDQWNTRAAEFHPQKFWQCGRDVGDALAAVADPWISLEARRDLYLRARASGISVEYELEARTPRA